MINPTAFVLIGRWFYALALIGSGVEQVITGQFVRLVPVPPSTVTTHGPAVLGVALIILGVSILIPYRARFAAGLTALLFLLLFVFQYVPAIAAAPQFGYVWTNPCKVLALATGALVVTHALQIRHDGNPGSSFQWPRRTLSIGRWAMGIFLLVCGVQHFVYTDFVVTLVPTWAGNPRLWAYFTGTALFAGGAGLLIPRTTRWAAALSGLMIFLWVLLLHIPRALAGPNQALETASVFEALALSGVALSIAGQCWTGRSKRV